MDIELPAQADIRSAADLYDRCCAALAGEGEIRIDCSSVERIDAAILQLLASLNGDLIDADRRLSLVERSLAFDRAVSVLGFDAALNGSRLTTAAR